MWIVEGVGIIYIDHLSIEDLAYMMDMYEHRRGKEVDTARMYK